QFPPVEARIGDDDTAFVMAGLQRPGANPVRRLQRQQDFRAHDDVKRLEPATQVLRQLLRVDAHAGGQAGFAAKGSAASASVILRNRKARTDGSSASARRSNSSATSSAANTPSVTRMGDMFLIGDCSPSSTRRC